MHKEISYFFSEIIVSSYLEFLVVFTLSTFSLLRFPGKFEVYGKCSWGQYLGEGVTKEELGKGSC